MSMKIGKMGEAKSAICTADETSITIRGKDLCHDLMGKKSFAEFFLFLVLGREPTADQTFFVDATLVSLAEHGLTPSVQAARMTLAAGPEAFQGAVAASILGSGSVVLGSSESTGLFLADCLAEAEQSGDNYETVARRMAQDVRDASKPLPGFGHPLHRPVDPRSERLLELAEQRGVIGDHTRMLLALRSVVADIWGKPLPLNVSGVIPAIMLDLDFPQEAIKGIPILARVAGTIAHLFEESQRPIGFLMSYLGGKEIEYDGG